MVTHVVTWRLIAQGPDEQLREILEEIPYSSTGISQQEKVIRLHFATHSSA